MWINTATSALYRLHSEIRADFASTSLPARLDDTVLASLGILPVVPTEPGHDPLTQNASEAAPVAKDGVWRQSWEITQADETQIAARLAARAQTLRAARDRRLAATDWTQLADAPVEPALWAAYRQALRDLPQQPGFPLEVNWPVAPDADLTDQPE